jgi:trimeric autotransporter adhesin
VSASTWLARAALMSSLVAGATGLTRALPTHAAAGVVVVTTTADAGHCAPARYSLRCAIAKANSDRSGDAIRFRIPPRDKGCTHGICSLALADTLPALTASKTTIDGYSQGGARANSRPFHSGNNARLVIQIKGSRFSPALAGLVIAGHADVVDGLSITDFAANADGVGGYGIAIGTQQATGVHVWGNFIGLTPAGKAAGNTYGIAVLPVQSEILPSRGNTIGGTSAAQRNVVSANSRAGILLKSTVSNTIEGNYIGTDPAGAQSRRNGTGIHIVDNGASRMPGSGDIVGTRAAPNLISGNLQFGILAENQAASGTYYGSVRGNWVGTTAAGTQRLPNGSGIVLRNASKYVIGGSVPGSGNVLAGNNGPGVRIIGGSGDAIQGNFIGITPKGKRLASLTNGIELAQATTSDVVGGASPSDGNTIAGNAGAGVLVGAGSGDPVHALISHNLFFGNGLGGIQLEGEALPDCPVGPLTGAPNDLTPCPLILTATQHHIVGEACRGCAVELYLAPSKTDAEGRTRLGSFLAGKCGSPPCTDFVRWSFGASRYTRRLKRSEYVVATATMRAPHRGAETSEFTRAIPVGNRLVVTTTADPKKCRKGALSLRCALITANTDKAGDEIDFHIPTSTCRKQASGGRSVPVCSIHPQGDLPALTASSTWIDGYSQTGAAASSRRFSQGLNGALTIGLAGGKKSRQGLRLEGSYDSVDGLDLTGFRVDGIDMGSHADHATVAGCFVGLTENGSTKMGNGIGIAIRGGGHDSVGGRALGDGNVISGNRSDGIQVMGDTGSTIRENLIGVDATGRRGRGNGFDGVFLGGTTAATVGGTRRGEGNVIASSFNDGISGLDARQTLIGGNQIGLSASGSIKLGNGLAGIYLTQGSNNTIGGVGAAGNAIGGNDADGIDLLADTGDQVTGNSIGNWKKHLPNGGVGVVVGGTGETPTAGARRQGGVGGETPIVGNVSANTITGNRRSGILIGQSIDDGDLHVMMSRNRMFGNNGQGIQLYGDDSCYNTALNRPNDYTPCPEIDSATPGSVSGLACAGCTVEVFVASNQPDDGGRGEGMTYLGSTVAGDDELWAINLPAGALTAGQYVTATATQEAPTVCCGYQETSMFSPNVAVSAA